MSGIQMGDLRVLQSQARDEEDGRQKAHRLINRSTRIWQIVQISIRRHPFPPKAVDFCQEACLRLWMGG